MGWENLQSPVRKSVQLAQQIIPSGILIGTTGKITRVWVQSLSRCVDDLHALCLGSKLSHLWLRRKRRELWSSVSGVSHADKDICTERSHGPWFRGRRKTLPVSKSSSFWGVIFWTHENIHQGISGASIFPAFHDHATLGLSFGSVVMGKRSNMKTLTAFPRGSLHTRGSLCSRGRQLARTAQATDLSCSRLCT